MVTKYVLPPKYYKFKNMLFTTLLLLSNFLFGQNEKIDSLKHKLNSTASINSKIDVMNELAWQLKNSNIEEGLSYAKKARLLSDSINYQDGFITSLNRLGTLYINNGDYKRSNENYKIILNLEKKRNDTFGIARAQNQLGIIHKRLGDYRTAISFAQKSIKNFSLLGKDKLVASATNNIGSLYKRLGRYEEAINAFRTSLTLREKLKDSIGMANCFLNLGTFHNELGNYNIALENLDKSEVLFLRHKKDLGLSKVYTNKGNSYFKLENSNKALEFYKKSIEIKDKLGVQANRDIVLNNIGIIYKNQGEFNTALSYFKKSAELKEKENINSYSGVYNNIGSLFQESKDLEEALSYYHKSLLEAKNNNNAIVQLEVLKNISEIYAELGLYNKSVQYNNIYNSFRDSIEISYKNAMELKVNYDEEKKQLELLKKDKEISKANLAQSISENKRKQTMIWALSIGFLLLTVLFFSIWQVSKQKQQILLSEKNEKIAQQKNQELLKNHELKTINTMMEAQEKERKRIASDLHDRLGSTLAMVKVHFKSVEDNIENLENYNKSQYEIANNLLDSACEEIRKIAHNMSSGLLSKFGLVAALNELKRTLEKANQLEIDFLHHGLDDRLDNIIEINVYRIVQELISNVLRHANANEITIQLIRSQNGLEIMVIDDGKGFDVNDKEFKEGMGLLGIRTRLEKLKGEIQIDSGKGAGTTITIEIP